MTSFLWKVWLWALMQLRMAIYHISLRMSDRTNSFQVHRLPFGLCANYDKQVAEALATKYVSLNTTILTPTVLDVCKDSSDIFFLMTKVTGRSFSVDGVTLHSMSDEQVSCLRRNTTWLVRTVKSPVPAPWTVGSAVSWALLFGATELSFLVEQTHSIP